MALPMGGCDHNRLRPLRAMYWSNRAVVRVRACPVDQWDGVAEPDPDRGEVDRSAECVVALVVAGGHRPVGLELVDAALHDVALLVDLAVEPGWPPALGAQPASVLLLVRGFGDGGLDPASAQVGADRAAGVGLIAQHPAGSGPWPAGSAAADPDRGHHRPEPEAVVPLPGTGDPRDRPTPSIGGQVNLARQPAPGPADRFPARLARPARRCPARRVGLAGRFLVIRPAPLCPTRSSRRPPRGCRRAGRGGHRRRADGRGPLRRPPRSSSPGLRSRRRRTATRPGPQPGCRHLTSGDAGSRWSSSARTRAARPATGHHNGSARTSR